LATRKQAEARLAELGFRLDPDSGSRPGMGHSATLDPIGRMAIGPDCRGDVIYDFTKSASAFWDEVIERAREIAPLLAPCPCEGGECEFHDPEDVDA
jgi:hypothetical protein